MVKSIITDNGGKTNATFIKGDFVFTFAYDKGSDIEKTVSFIGDISMRNFLRTAAKSINYAINEMSKESGCDPKVCADLLISYLQAAKKGNLDLADEITAELLGEDFNKGANDER